MCAAALQLSYIDATSTVIILDNNPLDQALKLIKMTLIRDQSCFMSVACYLIQFKYYLKPITYTEFLWISRIPIATIASIQ